MRHLRPVAIAAGVAGAIVGGRALLERRRAHKAESGDDQSNGDGGANREADLGTELRGAASDIAVSLLDRATARLEDPQKA
jgi:hypothetical protein